MFDPISIALLGGSALAQGVNSWFGSRNSERAAQQAAAQAQAAHGAAVAAARQEINTSAKTATGFLSPYETQGRQANTQLNDALGVNGRPAQSSFFTNFQTDPGYQATLDAGRRQIEHSSLFAGRGNSGATMKELFGFGQRQMQGQFQDRLDRLSGVAGRGQTAAGGLAGIEMDRGKSVAGINMQGGQWAGNDAYGQGQIAAQGIGQRTNAINSTIGGLVSAFGFNRGGAEIARSRDGVIGNAAHLNGGGAVPGLGWTY